LIFFIFCVFFFIWFFAVFDLVLLGQLFWY